MERKEFERMAPSLREHIVVTVRRLSADSDPALADDVAQDTLLRLWTMRDRLDSYTSLRALATVIARNRAIDLLRSSRATLTVDLDPDVADYAEASAHAPDPHQLLEGREAAARMDAILASLPSVQQAVLRMRHEEGMEISEIAAVTGSTPAAVRTALSRARHHVKQIFLNR